MPSGVDSAQNNVYDEINTIGGNKNGRETALRDIQNQRADGSVSRIQGRTRAATKDRSGVPGTLRENVGIFEKTLPTAQRRGLTSEVDVFGDNDYATVMGGSSLYQVRKSVSEEGYDGGTAPDFYVGPNGKALPSQYKDWIGTNIQKDLLDQAENTKCDKTVIQRELIYRRWWNSGCNKI